MTASPPSRKERADAFAVASQQRTAAAYDAGKIQPHLVSVATRSPELGWGLVSRDEPPRPGTTTDRAGRASRRRSARTAGSPPATRPG